MKSLITIFCVIFTVSTFAQKEISISFYQDYFSKAKIEARKLDLKLVFKKQSKDISNNCIIVWTRYDKGSLSKAYSIAKEGGKSVVLIGASEYSINNYISTTLLDLFGIGIASENLIPNKNNLIINGEGMSKMFNSLKLGCSEYSRLYGYLDPISSSAQCIGDGIFSKETNQKRCIGAEIKIGSGACLILIQPSRKKMEDGWFSMVVDNQIKELDNLEATKRILGWLKN